MITTTILCGILDGAPYCGPALVLTDAAGAILAILGWLV